MLRALFILQHVWPSNVISNFAVIKRAARVSSVTCNNITSKTSLSIKSLALVLTTTHSNREKVGYTRKMQEKTYLLKL